MSRILINLILCVAVLAASSFSYQTGCLLDRLSDSFGEVESNGAGPAQNDLPSEDEKSSFPFCEEELEEDEDKLGLRLRLLYSVASFLIPDYTPNNEIQPSQIEPASTSIPIYLIFRVLRI